MDRTNESVCADASKDERCSIACAIGGLSLPTACIGVKNGTRSRENPATSRAGPPRPSTTRSKKKFGGKHSEKPGGGYKKAAKAKH